MQGVPLNKEFLAYAEEGDILNLAMFGFTARQWREANVELAAKGHNVREYCSINELMVLSSLEGINAEMIKANAPFQFRLNRLAEIAKEQLATLERISPQNSLRKNDKGEFHVPVSGDGSGMFPVKKIESPKSDFDQKLTKALNFNPKEDKDKSPE